ncbi:MAG TPA: Xaa-Pro peptidase family protein [Candidatus Acidoferrales bacterium]|nr:Xaa-Pro peptidase family protein [Candidatus Acidoferrales bacterium]
MPREAAQFPRFATSEMAQRHARVHELMDSAGVHALLVYGAGRFASEIYWLTDWPGSREAYVLFEQGREPAVLLQLYNHVPMARVLSVIRDVRWAGPSTAETLLALMRERGLEEKKIGLVGGVPYQHYEKIRARYPRAELVDLSGKFRALRTIKSDAEIERIRFASNLTDQSLEALARGLKPGMREDEIPALLEPVYLNAGGYAGIHFMTSMPMRAPHFPVPAQYQSRRILERGDCLITEISGAYWGYSGQIHRTFSLGEGPTREWQELHAVAVEAFEAVAEVVKDGASTREIEEAAEVIHRRGYTIYDDLLHGANQYPPILQTRSTSRREAGEMILRENMVVVIQPNVITYDEKMGLQFGETVVVRRAGCETLNAFPRRWVTVPA